MTPKYYATVIYQQGKEVNATELNTLTHIARTHKGSYRSSNGIGGFVAFEFPDSEKAEGFKRQSQQLSEYVANVRIEESQ